MHQTRLSVALSQVKFRGKENNSSFKEDDALLEKCKEYASYINYCILYEFLY